MPRSVLFVDAHVFKELLEMVDLPDLAGNGQSLLNSSIIIASVFVIVFDCFFNI